MLTNNEIRNITKKIVYTYNKLKLHMKRIFPITVYHRYYILILRNKQLTKLKILLNISINFKINSLIDYNLLTFSFNKELNKIYNIAEFIPIQC